MINRESIIKIIKFSLYFIIFSVVILYSYFAFKDYLTGPEIIIDSPINGSTISTSTITIKGRVLHIQDIYINNRPILIDKSGNFTEKLLLYPGYNVSLITANDKFKRSTEYKLELIYEK